MCHSDLPDASNFKFFHNSPYFAAILLIYLSDLRDRLHIQCHSDLLILFFASHSYNITECTNYAFAFAVIYWDPPLFCKITFVMAEEY